MASSPLSTTPTSLDDLPPELHWTLTQYLAGRDLVKMRFLSAYWNAATKAIIRRNRWTFNIDNANKLAMFNDTFAGYTPLDEIAAGRFSFKLPALDTHAATVPLATFVQNFGHVVTSLSVNLSKTGSQEWYTDPGKCATVLGHVTLLLQGVKGQVEDLELPYYAGLRPCVIGHGPFPRLRTLIVGNNPIRGAPSDLGTLEEDFILLLSRSVPAIQRFGFKSFSGSNGGDPLFLANVLRNLVQVNSQVEVQLDMTLAFFNRDATGDSALLAELMTVAVRVVELGLVVQRGFEPLRRALNWIGAQSDWLKTLKLEADIEILPAAFKLPRLRALEELIYVRKAVESLIRCDSPDYFPSLRKVTAASTGNDFTVSLPKVTDVTLCRTVVTGVAAKRQGKYGQALFQLPPFPNVEGLTCSLKFIDLGSIVKLQSLRRLKVTSDLDSRNRDAFWKRMTHGAWKLTLEQIRALPEPSESEIRERAEPCFSDVSNLQELTVVVYRNEWAVVSLDALLFLSKTKRLQRLRKLELEVNTSLAVLQIYLNELRKYHNSVFLSGTN